MIWGHRSCVKLLQGCDGTAYDMPQNDGHVGSIFSIQKGAKLRRKGYRVRYNLGEENQ